MLISLTEEQRNNILGLIARAPKLPNESSLEFARVVTGLETVLMNPVQKENKNIITTKTDLELLDISQEIEAPESGKK